jgi:hypothetical protein
VAYLGSFSDSLVDDIATLLQVLLHGVCRADLTNGLYGLVSSLNMMESWTRQSKTYDSNHDVLFRNLEMDVETVYLYNGVSLINESDEKPVYVCMRSFACMSKKECQVRRKGEFSLSSRPAGTCRAV